MAEIYLNACSHGPPSRATLMRMVDALTREAEIGPERALAEAAETLATVRADAAALLASTPDRTGFCAATTPIWTRVADRLARPGARILLSDLEWGDHVRHAAALAERVGVRLDRIPAAEAIDPAAWAARLDSDVVLVSAPLVSSIAGRILPLEAIAALPRPDGTLLMTDVAQGLGRLPTERMVAAWDVVTGTARKWLRAPRQSALFTLSARAEAALGLRLQEIEGSIPNVALRLGLGQALAEAMEDGGLAPSVRARLAALDGALREGLMAQRPDLAIAPGEAPGTVTLLVPEAEMARIETALTAAKIVAKWCNPAIDEPYAGFDPQHRPLRLSPHIYNDPGDIDTLIAALRRAA